MKSLKIKLYNLSYDSVVKLETLSNEHRLLYNFLLEKVKEECDFKKINEYYKEFRKDKGLTINSKSSQNTSRNLINSVKSFYALKKKDKAAQFPYKFKSYKFFCSFMLDWNNGNGGFKIKDNKLIVNLLSKPITSSKLTIDLPEIVKDKEISEKNIKTITFKREYGDDNYYLVFTYSEKETNVVKNNNFLSIDLGISELVTCFSNKIKNFSIKNNKFSSLNKQIDILQSKRDLKVKNSRKSKKLSFRFRKKKRELNNKLKDFQHKVSRKIINICKENEISELIIGDIQTKQIIKNDNKKLKPTSKNFGLSRFKTFLEYKSKSEGMDFYKTNESFTTQENCLTGERDFKGISLQTREVNLTTDIKIDRDLNSAINIYKKTKGLCSSHFLNGCNFCYSHLDKMYFDTRKSVLKYEEIL